ncbi:MFS transporter [Acidisphaera sp. L21]|uniref:MFS transporter n=1 Tax=Acidisphaera sp. L21 TaxID=1641851 RepID=UPI00131B5CCE|nr:MFS transporter [Acidisphaera sp. L21]
MMSPSIGLPVINFFMADVGGGMGPFLSTWLSEAEKWPPDQIGLVLSAGLVAGMLMAIPAGALIDRLGRPRLMLAFTCLLIMGGTLAMFVVHGLWPILLAQVVVATGGALGAPALTALTMATIGKDGFPRQQGINQAATHTGNVVAAVLIWSAAFIIGASSSIAILGVMATGMLIALAFYPRDAMDHTRMAGRERRKKGDKRGSTRALLRNHRLLIVILSVGLFNFGSAAVLPLLAQRVSLEGKHDATQWLAVLVVVAQAVMVPVSWAAGRLADKFGRRILLITACAVVPARGALAALSHSPWALVAIEVLDGVGAGIMSVAGAAAVADLTYGGGRTQTAMGALGTIQSLASAVSASAAGFVVVRMGWTSAYTMLGVVPLAGIALLCTIQLRDEKPASDAPKDSQGEKAAAINARV